MTTVGMCPNPVVATIQIHCGSLTSTGDLKDSAFHDRLNLLRRAPSLPSPDMPNSPNSTNSGLEIISNYDDLLDKWVAAIHKVLGFYF